MNKYTLLCTLSFLATLYSCDIEKLSENQTEQINSFTDNNDSKKSKDVLVFEGNTSIGEDPYEHCKTVNLIAGQNQIAGTVNIDIEGDNLIITFITNSFWNIDATHLHVTNCEDESFPSTGSGNPKIGNFEYSSTHENGITEVTYFIDLSSDEIFIYNKFCFAAHAEVSGPSSETAWAEGEDFGGNSWAMYIEANLSDCDGDFVGG